jgi:putative phosphoesterase
LKIGVLSDTHDRLENTARAIRLLTERGAEILLHCGDIETAETVRLFAGTPTHFVLGNNDNPDDVIKAIADIEGFQHGEFGALTLGEKEIAWTHGHRFQLLRRLEHSNEFDFVFYGHSHAAESHRTGKTLVANPGALHRARIKTCLLVDLEIGELESIEVVTAR